MTLSATQLYRRGVENSNGHRHAAARRDLELALARTDDAELRARIVGTLAHLISVRGESVRAEQLCRAVLDGSGVSPQTAAVVHGQLGLLALNEGDFAGSIALLSRAIEGLGAEKSSAESGAESGAEDADELARRREVRANILLNRSVAEMQLGNLDAASADLGAAEHIFARLGDAASKAMCEHNAGYLALLQGDLVRALEGMQRAASVLRPDSAVSAAIGNLDRAEVLRDAGLTTEAELMLEQIARTFGAHGMRQARGEAEFNLSRSLLVHDLPRAAIVARAASRRFTSLNNERWAARCEGIATRAVLASERERRAGVRRGPALAAVADAAGVAARLDANGFVEEALAVELSRAQTLASAGETVNRPPRVPRSAPLAVRLLGHEMRAEIAVSRGKETAARRAAAAGIDDLAAWQGTFGSLDLSTSIAMHGSGLMRAGLRSALRSGSAAVAFEWAERARHLSQQVMPLRPPPDPELASDLSELRMLRADDSTGEWLSSPRARELRDRARGRQWAATTAAGAEARVNLEQARASLGDAALLSYVWDGMHLYCLIIDARTTRRITLADADTLHTVRAGLRADLEMSASVRSGPLAAVVGRALDFRLEQLSRLLLAPALAHTSAARLVLTVPGVLGEIPWGMLPDMNGRSFTAATSATRWVGERDAMRARLAEASTLHAGFVAGPDVERAGDEVARSAAVWRARTDASTGASTREGVVTVLTGVNATTSAVAALAATADVLHIAAHGRHAAENPMFAGLELADGALFGYDIDLVPRVPGTVVLSACEMGRSSVRWGEEAVGMTRGWLHAGTRCVIAASVTVADEVASELLGAMHMHLAAGALPADALAAASTSTGLRTPFQCHGAGF